MDVADRHSSSQWLGLHEQNMQNIKPDKFPAWIGNELTKSHPYVRSYWQWLATEGGESLLFRLAGPERLLTLQELQSHTHAHIGSIKWTQWMWTTQRVNERERRRKHKNLEGKGRRIGSVDWIQTHYMKLHEYFVVVFWRQAFSVYHFCLF